MIFPLAISDFLVFTGNFLPSSFLSSFVVSLIFLYFTMRIDSSLSSASVDGREDSPMSSPSAVSDRASDSTDDNIPLIRRPIPHCDGSGFLWRSVRTTPVHEGSSGRVPVRQLVDEDVIDLEDDDVEPQEGGDHPMGLLSIITDDALNRIARACRFLMQLSMLAPRADERPWTPPQGWMCLYEAFFSHSRLWFPLPRLLTSYAAARDIALTHFTHAAMRNVVAALL